MKSNAHIQHTKKILVSGAFATGKSILCHELVSYFNSQEISVELVSETARRCPLPLNREQTALASSWLLGEQISSEAEAVSKKPEIVLCDRGIPDIISHTTVLNSSNGLQKDMFAAVIEMGRNWVRTYEMIFWARLDPGRPIESDGYRLVDKEYQILLENSLKEVLEDYNIVPIVLPQETAHRFKEVLSHVGHHSIGNGM